VLVPSDKEQSGQTVKLGKGYRRGRVNGYETDDARFDLCDERLFYSAMGFSGEEGRREETDLGRRPKVVFADFEDMVHFCVELDVGR
jgi:hypothetical protein